jgi:Uma2 family endonuclease
MTVEQFWQLLEDGAFQCELHHGDLVKASRPKWKRVLTQWRIRDLLKALLGASGIVDAEVPFRPRPEHELWAADEDDALHGAPDIVIEVLSPSNTTAEIAGRRSICLRNGSRAFWTVDSARREIKVSTPDPVTRTYKSGDRIPLVLAGDETLEVNAVFEVE